VMPTIRIDTNRSIISHRQGTLSRYSLRTVGLSHGYLSSGSILLRTKLKKEESWE
jgi:hypothetical protein